MHKSVEVRSPRATTGRRVPLALAVVFTTLTGDAVSKSFDHLKCFKIRDERTFNGSSVDLDALPVEFGLQSCTIKGRAEEFCVCADKT